MSGVQGGPLEPRSAERDCWIAFSHVPGIGPTRFGALLDRFGGAEVAWRAPVGALSAVLDQRSLQALIETRRNLVPEQASERVAELGATVVTRRDPDYPALLQTIPAAPFLLYVRGDVTLLSARSVAVVGTRKASDYGRKAARQIAGDLAAAGVVVVSGLAHGIDTMAHSAALERGRTVAVLGSGPDVVYPASNRRLQADIATLGALVTEYPPGTAPDPGNFPARNRIVSGLTMATVVVEASLRSGAMITAQYALDHGRDVLAVPGPIFSPGSLGVHHLISAGAGLVQGADDVLTALDLAHLSVGATSRPQPTDPLEAALISALLEGPALIDALARTVTQPVAQVARALQLLEIRGLVQHLGDMRWVAT
jgi:DNA processing protein